MVLAETDTSLLTTADFRFTSTHRYEEPTYSNSSKTTCEATDETQSPTPSEAATLSTSPTKS